MRKILDEQNPVSIEPLFSYIFHQLQRGKCLERMVYMDDYYLFSIDATGYFSSNMIHCRSCCTKTNSKTGEVTYYHQMLSGAIVHPDFKEVIPFAPESIIKQDGETKNDIERNASRFWCKKIL
jgi:hypothetical protein